MSSTPTESENQQIFFCFGQTGQSLRCWWDVLCQSTWYVSVNIPRFWVQVKRDSCSHSPRGQTACTPVALKRAAWLLDSKPNYLSSEHIYHGRRGEVVIKGLNNIFKQKTVFSKVIIVRCYKIIFPGFSKFHQKKFPALLPLPQFLLAVRQLTVLFLRARVFEEPVSIEESTVSQDKFHFTTNLNCQWRDLIKNSVKNKKPNTSFSFSKYKQHRDNTCVAKGHLEFSI